MPMGGRNAVEHQSQLDLQASAGRNYNEQLNLQSAPGSADGMLCRHYAKLRTLYAIILKTLLFIATLFINSCTTMPTNRDMPYSQIDILEYLERYDQENYHFFIDLEHPYFFTAGSRLTLYADKTRWAIVFEKSGYSTGSSAGEIEFAYFGNCLTNLKSEIPGNETTSNMFTEWLIDNTELERIQHDFELVAKDKKEVKVRDSFLPIEHDLKKYEAKNIKLEHYENPDKLIDFPSLIRYLDEEYPNIFRATDTELRKHLPADLPKLMKIDKWHHETYYQGVGKKPSEYETYKMIADILVSKDTTKWKPALKPNNDWRNWTKAGYM
jgi:hypothetical protein